MRIAIASDHRGYEMKQELKKYLKNQNYEVLDLGTTSKEPVDYPKYGILLGETIKEKKADLGIAICGTGIGISIACNKVKGIICANVSNKKEAINNVASFKKYVHTLHIISFTENMYIKILLIFELNIFDTLKITIQLK